MSQWTTFWCGVFVGSVGFYLTLLALSVPSMEWLP
jgi:hypothetical protein